MRDQHPATGPGGRGDVDVVLEVVAKTVVADDVATLTLAHPDGARLPDWAPGAHVDLVLPNGVTRQYSLCGDRWDPLHLPRRRAARAGRPRRLGVRARRAAARRTGSASAARATTSRSCPPSATCSSPAASASPRSCRCCTRPTCSARTGSCSTAAAAAPRWPSSTSSPATATGCRSSRRTSAGCSTCAAFLGEPRAGHPGLLLRPRAAARRDRARRARRLAAAQPAHRAVRRRRARPPRCATRPFERRAGPHRPHA